MSIPHSTQDDKSELHKFKLYYEHVPESRPTPRVGNINKRLRHL